MFREPKNDPLKKVSDGHGFNVAVYVTEKLSADVARLIQEAIDKGAVSVKDFLDAVRERDLKIYLSRLRDQREPVLEAMIIIAALQGKTFNLGLDAITVLEQA